MREPKSAAGRRRIPLTHAMIEALKVHSAAQGDYIASHDDPQRNGLVAGRDDGRPLASQHLPAAWTRARDAAGVSVRFRELRHTHASLLLSAGAHPKTLEERLGHSSTAFTMNVYAHLLPSVQEEAVANLEVMLEKAESKPESSDD